MKQQTSFQHRILTILLLGSLGFVMTYCASTSELEKEEFDEMLDRAAEEMPMSVNVDVERYISQLSDNYAMLHNTVPESFRNIRAEEERRNSNQGYRVQIISTRNLQEVETIETEFLTWMRENEISPMHESYIRFRQPYYRLHLGDFRSRAEAIQFSQIVRQKYPNAWVVPDQIDPEAIENRNIEMEEEVNGAVEDQTDINENSGI
ncbi:MAG: SPOR domain-containing protein [Balneolales bacterium]